MCANNTITHTVTRERELDASCRSTSTEEEAANVPSHPMNAKNTYSQAPPHHAPKLVARSPSTKKKAEERMTSSSIPHVLHGALIRRRMAPRT